MNATDKQAGVKPTIVLVHGAFADASSWNGVIGRRQQQGYTVIATANPLRGLAADSAYTASLLNQIDGPVLLVGHSYAGAVITNAATSTPNVVGLVYVAAFATEEGENLNDVENGSQDSILGAALVQYKYPAGPDGETAVELAVNPALFREAFAADLPAETVALMAATQRPTAVTAFSEASGPPAWKELPCWTVVATGDKAAGADVIRSEAQRAAADITEVEGSHVIMISQQAHLAARLAQVGVRRRHVRAQRGRLRQPGSRRDRHPPVAARCAGSTTARASARICSADPCSLTRPATATPEVPRSHPVPTALPINFIPSRAAGTGSC